MDQLEGQAAPRRIDFYRLLVERRVGAEPEELTQRWELEFLLEGASRWRGHHAPDAMPGFDPGAWTWAKMGAYPYITDRLTLKLIEHLYIMRV